MTRSSTGLFVYIQMTKMADYLFYFVLNLFYIRIVFIFFLFSLKQYDTLGHNIFAWKTTIQEKTIRSALSHTVLSNLMQRTHSEQSDLRANAAGLC